jgi:hypothetical protein
MDLENQYSLIETCPGCLGLLRKHENDKVYQMSCGDDTKTKFYKTKFYKKCLFCRKCVLEIKRYKIDECPCCLKYCTRAKLIDKNSEQPKPSVKIFVCEKNEIVYLRDKSPPDFGSEQKCVYTQTFELGEQPLVSQQTFGLADQQSEALCAPEAEASTLSKIYSTVSKIYSIRPVSASESLTYLECLLCEKCDQEICRVLVCQKNRLFCHKCALEEIQTSPSEFRFAGIPSPSFQGLKSAKDLQEHFKEAEKIFEAKFLELAREEETEISKIRDTFEQQRRDIQRKEQAELEQKRQEFATKVFPLRKKLAEYKFNSNVAVYFERTAQALHKLSTEFSNDLPVQQLAPQAAEFMERCGLLAADFKNPQEFFENLTDAEEDLSTDVSEDDVEENKKDREISEDGENSAGASATTVNKN